jgi:NAD(P)-dependent dehydrogenase (short-subunit alcohol dehydrogenase family)
MRMTGKVWVVTGGADGMGRELVLQLLARGARVAAADVRADGLAEAAQLAARGRRSLRSAQVEDGCS